MNISKIKNTVTLAEHYFRNNQPELAKHLLIEIIREDESHPKANELLAYIYGNKGDTKLAFLYLTKACKHKDASPEALYYLGAYLLKNREYKEAREKFIAALKKSGESYEILHNLGTTLAHLGDFQTALSYYEKALHFQSNNPTLAFNIARIYDELSKHKQAIEYYDKAIQLDDHYYEAWSNKGLTLNHLKLYNEAIACYDKAILLNPNHPEAWSNKGLTLKDLKLYNEAIACFDKAILLNPNYPEAWSNKGFTLNELKLYNEAITCLDKAIALDPNYPEAWSNKGISLNELKLYNEAIACFDKAIALDPNYPEAWSNKGATLCNIKENCMAMQCYENAIKLNPSYFDPINNRSLLNLNLKKYSEGWSDYYARLKVLNFKYPLSTDIVPVWDGKKYCKKLLIVGEQGLGDQIFFSPLLNMVSYNATQAYMLTDNRLTKIFERSFQNIVFFDDINLYDPTFFDAQIPIGDLAKIFDLHPPHNQLEKPYLIHNSEITNNLNRKYSPPGKTICGISWKSLNVKFGSNKSIDLLELEQVLTTPNCHFTNLQYGNVDDEIQQLKERRSITLTNLYPVDVYKDLDGLLSIIECCDVVITTSNLNAHLAGALGKETILLAPYSQGKIWYWNDNLVNDWYPSIKQFFQSKDLSWKIAIESATKELERIIARKN